ncbi:MAG TPA: peptide chain release factor N(5)-glutamine methyltransferase [Verrucomicrobiae bacterium]|nr:peptide chain release factor N(5)-glutamine methyltransferase [Verrucomicrobiae bacterium]
MSTAAAASTIRALLAEAIARLEATGLPTARQDAEWLLASRLGVERFALYLDPARSLESETVRAFEALVARRAAHEPLQHLLGFEDFRGLRLRVTPDALIPRPETEGLVEWALELLALSGGPDTAPALPQSTGISVADIGTGSGAIACALAAARPDIQVFAVEASSAALVAAAKNVYALGLAGRVRLMRGDLLGPLAAQAGRLAMVVANLPYLPSAVLPTLPREVRDFEPRAALDGGPDGLALLRRLVAAAPGALRPGGRLVLEIGEEQAGALASLMAAEGFTDIASRADLRGIERYIAGAWA